MEREFVWRTYIAIEALPTTKKVEIIDKNEFVAAALNEDEEIFIMNVAALAKLIIMPIHLFCQAQVTY